MVATDAAAAAPDASAPASSSAPDATASIEGSTEAAEVLKSHDKDGANSNGVPTRPRDDGTFPRLKSVDIPDAADTDCEPDEADCIVDMAELEMREAILRHHANESGDAAGMLQSCQCVLRTPADGASQN